MENKTQALKLRNCWILREKNRVRTSQGSAATVCRWGEQIYLGWMSKFPRHAAATTITTCSFCSTNLFFRNYSRLGRVSFRSDEEEPTFYSPVALPIIQRLIFHCFIQKFKTGSLLETVHMLMDCLSCRHWLGRVGSKNLTHNQLWLLLARQNT